MRKVQTTQHRVHWVSAISHSQCYRINIKHECDTRRLHFSLLLINWLFCVLFQLRAGNRYSPKTGLRVWVRVKAAYHYESSILSSMFAWLNRYAAIRIERFFFHFLMDLLWLWFWTIWAKRAALGVSLCVCKHCIHYNIE